MLAATLAALVGCSVPVAVNLDESDANRVVVALDEGGVAATKESDPDHTGRWRVTVPRDDNAAAIVVLDQRNLPPPKVAGLLDALDDGAMIPSRGAEHARWVAGTAGELERSLRDVDGVLAARVHLAVPLSDPLAPNEPEKQPTASVLLRHQGPEAPLTDRDIQRLVAGAVPGLDADQVSVVVTQTTAPSVPIERPLAHVGPITVARTSLASLKIAVGTTVLLLLALLGAVVVAWLRLRRVQLALDEALNLAPSRAKDDPVDLAT